MTASTLRQKCLHVITGLGAGGAERVLFNLLSSGSLQTFDCSVVSLSDDGIYGERLRERGVPVISLGGQDGKAVVPKLLALRRLVRELHPDLVQGWMYHGNLVASIVKAVSKNRPTVCWNIRASMDTFDDEKRMTRNVIKMNRFISGWPDAVLYNSVLAKSQHEKTGFSSKRSCVIPNGFDLSYFKPSAACSQSMRRELNIAENAVIIGHVARFSPVKDHSAFIRAAVVVGEKFKDVNFVMCGTGVTVDNIDLFNLIPEIMRNRFHFLGERQDVNRVMCAFDVFCQSSWGEAFPNTLGEAMSSGVPCVTSDVGDSAMIVGGTGFVVQPRSEDMLASALIRIVAMPTNERRALGRAARERIREKYSLGFVSQKYLNLYEQLTR
jgi:glycosyltransferase involved in cell wall biosynthesis